MMLIESIIESFKNTNKIRATAKETGCSWNRVVKVLASNGIVVNDIHAQILELHNKGMNPSQISKIVGRNIKTVKSYLPKVRPYYGIEQSENARRIIKCRESKKHESD